MSSSDLLLTLLVTFVAAVFFLLLPTERRETIVLDSPGCAAIKALGLTPQPLIGAVPSPTGKEDACLLSGKTRVSLKIVTIDDVDIAREHVIAFKAPTPQ